MCSSGITYCIKHLSIMCYRQDTVQKTMLYPSDSLLSSLPNTEGGLALGSSSSHPSHGYTNCGLSIIKFTAWTRHVCVWLRVLSRAWAGSSWWACVSCCGCWISLSWHPAPQSGHPLLNILPKFILFIFEVPEAKGTESPLGVEPYCLQNNCNFCSHWNAFGEGVSRIKELRLSKTCFHLNALKNKKLPRTSGIPPGKDYYITEELDFCLVAFGMT